MFKFALLLVLPALALTQLHDDFVTAAEKLFDDIDKNSDNRLTRQEIDDYFQAMDTNGDNKIEKHEFDVYMSAVDNFFADHIQQLYDRFDGNDDHHVDHVDFDAWFANHDLDHNGAINHMEYYQFTGANQP